MSNVIIMVCIAVVSIVIGYALGYFLKIKATEKTASRILDNANSDAEAIKQRKILEAKEEALKMKGENERIANEKNAKLQQLEQRLRQKENSLNQTKTELQKKQKELDLKRNESDAIKANLEVQLEKVENKDKELDDLRKKAQENLEAIAGISAVDAKQQLIDSLKAEAQTEAISLKNEILEEAQLQAGREAKKIVIQTIQRVGAETAIENAVTVFNIDNDEIKGRIIGREGRNIRALEAATGIEIIVDDTPEAIVLSGFDPVRREVARLALHQLVTDGRIHPARIEEVVSKTKKQLEEEIAEVGKRTYIDLGIHGLHPELVRLIGKMKYRSSYGQNLLQHSRETANLCAVMASELGLPNYVKAA
ncbi:MAG: DUF3552 domain-containing protein, partial [Bacteroidales bacterium]|nr:DUF3552 domain-containing protein [Bacteroidales bacterium]